MPTFRTPDGDPVPAVTADGMRAVDRVAVEEVGLDLPVMTANAGRTPATAVRDAAGPAAGVVAACDAGRRVLSPDVRPAWTRPRAKRRAPPWHPTGR